MKRTALLALLAALLMAGVGLADGGYDISWFDVSGGGAAAAVASIP